MKKTESKIIPVTSLKGVGPRVAEKLARLNIFTIQDVLFHLPLRYEDRNTMVSIGSLRPGSKVVIEGEIDYSETGFSRSGRKSRRMLLCHVSDGTGAITLRFFQFNKSQQQRLSRGTRIRCYGEARRVGNHLEMIHPEFLPLEECHNDQQPGLTPVYPTTEGIHQLTLKRLVEQALELLRSDDSFVLDEYLPSTILEKLNYPDLTSSLQFLHYPPVNTVLQELESNNHPAQQRLAFEELLAHHLSLQQLRYKMQESGAVALADNNNLLQKFISSLPFTLTQAQQRVIADVKNDVDHNLPMLRLVQGDVGSGKTIVAVAAVLFAIASGKQAAVMAPTEILAEQHFNNFKQWLEPLGIKVAWLSGKLKAKLRREMLELIGSGEAPVVVGTHALFQDEVEFNDLALIVIDEQHRFGVHQRLALKEKGRKNNQSPHQLIMTATPIPRTLAMTAYSDLDTSIIDELPPGRTPVITVVLPDTRRMEVIDRVKSAIAEGRQVYWVCTLIEESEVLQCQAAEDTFALLKEQLPDFEIGLVHGRMKPAEKEAIMSAFKQQDINLLVATTVIEVGVDVPNASLMIIENAERLGLSQLHQLRGRVGRGTEKSSCLLMYSTPLGKTAESRLGIMRKTSSGFEIAEQDLKLRGPGEVLGTRQTGDMNFRIADILRDEALIPKVQQVAQQLITDNPQSIEPIISRWLGKADQYASV